MLFKHKRLPKSLIKQTLTKSQKCHSKLETHTLSYSSGDLYQNKQINRFVLFVLSFRNKLVTQGLEGDISNKGEKTNLITSRQYSSTRYVSIE